jgi:hypothetical protein
MNTLEIQTINLDHFLPMETIGYINPEKRERGKPDFKAFSHQLHLCLGAFTGDWFLKLRKPHFQKKTDTWQPEQCVELLKSIIGGAVIPAIHLIHPEKNGNYYVLDGAHRLSTIRAWVTDDWGDESDPESALYTRQMVEREIGSFQAFEQAYENWNTCREKGNQPEQTMSETELERAQFIAVFREDKPLLRAMVTWLEPQYASIVFNNDPESGFKFSPHDSKA